MAGRRPFLRRRITHWIFLTNLLSLLSLTACANIGIGGGGVNVGAKKEVVVKPATKSADIFTVAGRVMYRDAPVKGAKVLVYKTIDDLLKRASVIEAETDPDGNYTMKVPAGRYFFIARKGDEYFSYSGRNPVSLTGTNDYWVGFQSEKITPIETTDYPDDELSSAIGGTVLLDDKPVKDAFVTIFLDDSDDFKGLGYNSAPTDENGEFFFDYLPESEYYMLVRKRASG